jgi:hypothetical protein
MECNGTGHLYSIDQPNPVTPLPYGKEPGWLVPSELKDRWTLILGSTREQLLPLLQQLQEIDAFLHDSEHTYETMRFEYEAVWPYLKTPGLLLTDNVHGTTAFRDFVGDQQLKTWITFDGLGAIRKDVQRNVT